MRRERLISCWVLLIICPVVKSYFLLSSAEKSDDFEGTIFGACRSPSRDRVIFFQAQFDVPRIGNFWIQDGFIDYEFTLSNQLRDGLTFVIGGSYLFSELL